MSSAGRDQGGTPDLMQRPPQLLQCLLRRAFLRPPSEGGGWKELGAPCLSPASCDLPKPGLPSAPSGGAGSRRRSTPEAHRGPGRQQVLHGAAPRPPPNMHRTTRGAAFHRRLPSIPPWEASRLHISHECCWSPDHAEQRPQPNHVRCPLSGRA